MKKRIIVIASVLTVAVVVAAVSIGVTAENDENAQSLSMREETIRHEQSLKAEPINGQNAATFTAQSDSADTGLQEKSKSVEAEEAEKDANDIKAYPILRKYGADDVEDALIDDKEEDYNAMKSMCELLEEEDLSEDEAVILRNYLDRRYYRIDDNPELKAQIENILK